MKQILNIFAMVMDDCSLVEQLPMDHPKKNNVEFPTGDLHGIS